MSQPRPDPEGAPPKGTSLRTGNRLRRYLPLALLATGLLVFLALGGYRYLSLEALAQHREKLQALVAEQEGLALLAFIALYTVCVAFSVPGALVMTVAGGFLFGPWLGAAASVVGATLGATVLFLAARSALGDLLKDRAGPALAKMRVGFQENALSYLLVLRLIPLFPFWLVNLVPALLGVSLGVFLAGTFFGIIPASLVYASLGNGLGTLFEAGSSTDLGNALYQREVLLPLAGLALLSLLPIVYKKVKKPKSPE